MQNTTSTCKNLKINKKLAITIAKVRQRPYSTKCAWKICENIHNCSSFYVLSILWWSRKQSCIEIYSKYMRFPLAQLRHTYTKGKCRLPQSNSFTNKFIWSFGFMTKFYLQIIHFCSCFYFVQSKMEVFVLENVKMFLFLVLVSVSIYMFFCLVSLRWYVQYAFFIIIFDHFLKYTLELSVNSTFISVSHLFICSFNKFIYLNSMIIFRGLIVGGICCCILFVPFFFVAFRGTNERF